MRRVIIAVSLTNWFLFTLLTALALIPSWPPPTELVGAVVFTALPNMLILGANLRLSRRHRTTQAFVFGLAVFDLPITLLAVVAATWMWIEPVSADGMEVIESRLFAVVGPAVLQSLIALALVLIAIVEFRAAASERPRPPSNPDR